MKNPPLLAYRQVSVLIRPAALIDSVAAPTTKSGEYDDTVIVGEKASVDANSGWVADVLASLKAKTPATRPILPLTMADSERIFKEAISGCQLQTLRCTPHCCRHGGPSTDVAIAVRDLRAVQRRGRWKGDASVRRYEKTGRLHRQLARLTAVDMKKAKRAAALRPALLI